MQPAEPGRGGGAGRAVGGQRQRGPHPGLGVHRGHVQHPGHDGRGVQCGVPERPVGLGDGAVLEHDGFDRGQPGDDGVLGRGGGVDHLLQRPQRPGPLRQTTRSPAWWGRHRPAHRAPPHTPPQPHRTRAHHPHPLRLSVPQTLQATTDRPPTTSGHQVSYSTEPQAELANRRPQRDTDLSPCHRCHPLRVLVAASLPRATDRPRTARAVALHLAAAQPNRSLLRPTRPRKPCRNPAAVKTGAVSSAGAASTGFQCRASRRGNAKPPCPTLRQRSSRAAEPQAVPSRCTSRPPQRRRSQRS